MAWMERVRWINNRLDNLDRLAEHKLQEHDREMTLIEREATELQHELDGLMDYDLDDETERAA